MSTSPLTRADLELPGDIRPSGQSMNFRMANSVTINRGDLVIILNPGTTGTASPGAATADSICAGVALESKTSGTGGQDFIEVDIGGCLYVASHTANLNINGAATGQVAVVAGGRSVAASGDGADCGRISAVIVGGAGTSRVIVQLYPMSLSIA